MHNAEKDDVQYRSRAGRLDKWRELSQKAQAELKLPVAVPERIMWLITLVLFFGVQALCTMYFVTLHFVEI